jgi:hypothetical protein
LLFQEKKILEHALPRRMRRYSYETNSCIGAFSWSACGRYHIKRDYISARDGPGCQRTRLHIHSLRTLIQLWSATACRRFVTE